MSANGAGTNEDRPASLLNFAQQMVREAEKEAGEIRANAEKESRSEAQRLIAEAERDALAKSHEITAKADQEANHLLKRARKQAQDIARAAEQKADDILSQAAAEAELKARAITTQVNERVRSAVDEVLPRRDEGTGASEADRASGATRRSGRSTERAAAPTSSK